MGRRVPARPGRVGDHRPRAHQRDRHQGRALQPQPRRGVSGPRRVAAARPRQPQRHGRLRRRGSAATTSCSPATSFRSATRTWRSSTTWPRRFPTRARCSSRRGSVDGTGTGSSSPVGRRRRKRVRRLRADDDHAPPRSEPVPRRAGARRSRDHASPKVGRAAAKLCKLAFELAKSTDVDLAGQRRARRPVRRHAGRRRRHPAARPRRLRRPPQRRARSRRLAQRLEPHAIIASRTFSPRP